MIYQNSREWLDANHKRVLIFGMSGLGKTFLSNILRSSGNWFHYSIDYRIGTNYLNSAISADLKKEAMRSPYLRQLLKTDSMYIGPKFTMNNLVSLSMYLGKPGDIKKGGVNFIEYMKRQEQHRKAEISSMLDTSYFIKRSLDLYDYPHFICDSSGSMCEVVNPNDPDDSILTTLSKSLLLVWIEGCEYHQKELISRFEKSPKPMYYQPAFLKSKWLEFIEISEKDEKDIDPDEFVRWVYSKALSHRQPRYLDMAKWGVSVKADKISAVKNTEDFETLIADAIEQRINQC